MTTRCAGIIWMPGEGVKSRVVAVELPGARVDGRASTSCKAPERHPEGRCLGTRRALVAGSLDWRSPQKHSKPLATPDASTSLA